MSLRQAMIGAVIVGMAVAGVYHLFETVDPQQDLWFAGLAAGLGLVTVPILIDLVAVDLVARLLRRERHLPRVRMVLVTLSGLLGLLIVGWVSAGAATDPAAGAGFVLLPVLVFAFGVVAVIVLVLVGADERQAAE